MNSSQRSRIPLTERLRYIHEGEAHPLPSWTHFACRLGAALSSLDQQFPATVAVVVPDRRYLSVLCAASYIALKSVEESTEEKKQAYYEELTNLPSGTPVALRKSGRILKGWLRHRREELIGVQTECEEGGGTVQLISPSRSTRIGPLREDLQTLPKNQRGYQVRANVDFIESVLPNVDALSFLSKSSLVCLIIGQISRLEREIHDTQLRVEGEKPAEGNFQDLMRVRRFGGKLENSRVRLHKRSGTDPPEMSGDAEPEFVLFDGSLSFVKWSNYFPDKHQVAVIDRHDYRFDEATEELDQAVRMSLEDIDMKAVAPLPASVEILGFYR